MARRIKKLLYRVWSRRVYRNVWISLFISLLNQSNENIFQGFLLLDDLIDGAFDNNVAVVDNGNSITCFFHFREQVRVEDQGDIVFFQLLEDLSKITDADGIEPRNRFIEYQYSRTAQHG